MSTYVIAITSDPNSELAQLANWTIIIPGRLPGDIDPAYERQVLDATTGGLLGALFEIGSTLFFNAIATYLQKTDTS